MQHIAAIGGHKTMVAGAKEQWRNELAEMLAAAEKDGRDLTDTEWKRFCELIPPAERARLAERITSKISPGRAAHPCGASQLGLLGPARG